MNWPWTKLDKPYALPSREYSPNLKAGSYTWEDWHAEQVDEYPVRYWLQEALPSWLRVSIKAPLKRAWYWFKSHTYRRHHVLDLRCPRHGVEYAWGWVDRDIAMLAACFRILEQFMLEEFEPSNDAEARSSAVEHELTVLYSWWRVDRKAAWDRYWDVGDKLSANKTPINSTEYAAHIAAGHALEAWDGEMLGRLMAVRKYLWS